MKEIKVEMSPVTCLWSHQELAVSLHLRYLSHVSSVSRFWDCTLPHPFRSSDVNGSLLFSVLNSIPFLKLSLHPAHTLKSPFY